MNLNIANLSTQISSAALQPVIDAISRQIAEHFQPEWDLAANLTGISISLQNGQAPIQGNENAVIYVGDSSQDPTTGIDNVYGYHFQNYAKVPYGFVYLDVCKEYGEIWTCTLSHEVLELIRDPDAAMTIGGPAPNGASGTVYYDLEVCDPVQGDSYQIDNVLVSNFTGKSYFGLIGGGKSNYLGLNLTPFGVRPGGYCQYEDSDGTHQIQGSEVTARQIAGKKRMKRGRRNERRSDRLVRRKAAG